MPILARGSCSDLVPQRTGLAALLVAGAAALAPTALAHTGGPGHDGFAAGFSHPFSGLDHVLAMGAVGLWAAQRGGRAAWVLPLAFLLVLAAGAGLGASRISLPGVEVGIALSCLALGACIASNVRMGAALAAGLVAVFALLHGHAHGTEMTPGTAVASYGLGFLASTASLLALGGALGLLARKVGAPLAVRAAGLGIVAGGLVTLGRALV